MGGWLSLCLRSLGANVSGYALNPIGEKCFFYQANVETALTHDCRSDIRDVAALRSALISYSPDIVFHLAAQPIVRESFKHPAETFSVNAMGVVHLLDCLRDLSSVQATVIITSDKCYRDISAGTPLTENDALGGDDPYSASKGCAEIISNSYRASFGNGPDASIAIAHLATARAGNVIGGGDWAVDRLVPDCIRAFDDNQPVKLRYPQAIRPWQHVLEPICGYLLLAQSLVGPGGEKYASAWNFGPESASHISVAQLANTIAQMYGGKVQFGKDESGPNEKGVLRLDSEKSLKELGWRPRMTVEEAIEKTVAWYKEINSKKSTHELTMTQIGQYFDSTCNAAT